MIASAVPPEGGSPTPDPGSSGPSHRPDRGGTPSSPGRAGTRGGPARGSRSWSTPDLEAPPDRSTDTYTGPIALVGALLGHVWALFVQPPSLTERLGRASAGARMLVVPQSLPEVDVLVDTAYEPVTVVPTDPPHPHGTVVLALAHRTTDETIEAAFDAASSGARRPRPAPP